MEIDFTHHQSAHCENGVVSNLMKHNGFQVSEPMVFGIGSGLLYCYIPFLMVDRAPVITYRAMPGFIFKRFAKRVGIKIKREKFKDPKAAKARLDDNLKNDNPVGLQVGVYNLIYFPDEYRFHFNAHNLVVYGKQDDRYLISDPVMGEVTSLTDKELEKVRFAKGAFAPKGHMYYPTSFPEKLDLESAIKKGIKQTCRDMLAPAPIVGVNGIKTIAKLIRKWPKKKGAKVANHYLGQIVRMQEEIGTGGGGFRYIYAAFLQESGKLLNNDALIALAAEMTTIGDMWRDFAVDASRIYRNRSAKTEINVYEDVADQLETIANREKEFFKKLKKRSNTMIEIRNLSKKYKGSEFYSVANLDLTIDEGEIFGLLGPNGAGKTTLISMLSSLLKASSGSFSINGLTYKEDRDQLQQLIGTVPQEYALYPSLSAYENLVFFGSAYGLKGSSLKQTILHHLEILGLSNFANKKVATFSGGMKRRVNLIASILHNPKVLFLDEPTVGVDVQSKKVIINHLQELNKNGTTIIYTSHHLNEAEYFCTTVAIIDEGQIVAKGKPRDLIVGQDNASNLEEVFLEITGKALRDYA